jgi:hypothetical protein
MADCGRLKYYAISPCGQADAFKFRCKYPKCTNTHKFFAIMKYTPPALKAGMRGEYILTDIVCQERIIRAHSQRVLTGRIIRKNDQKIIQKIIKISSALATEAGGANQEAFLSSSRRMIFRAIP